MLQLYSLSVFKSPGEPFNKSISTFSATKPIIAQHRLQNETPFAVYTAKSDRFTQKHNTSDILQASSR